MPPERLRASHADRERVFDVLRSAVEDGRLDISEFEERAERVYRARTLGELPEITRDLVPTEKQPIQPHSGPITAFFGDVRRSGRWVLRTEEYVVAVGGNADVDLREALMMRNRVQVNAFSLFGRVRIRVPEGIDVRMGGRAFLGRRTSSARPPEESDAPVLEIAGFSLFGSVSVHAPRRRSRRPRWRLPRWRDRRHLR
ncbi:DUF1707 domain-containing protein [Nocardiopsis gilva YIM 90087]|uniref:DUF1707 domain-containing protein n=1 Tax=Nocardiopsis gilva YIM 90087 TaxID=1235441 RepID=A0A223SD41_9ACTN|nr:DUF1707 domain-containing protein [Nocardiopsis gilva YIM 90087]